VRASYTQSSAPRIVGHQDLQDRHAKRREHAPHLAKIFGLSAPAVESRAHLGTGGAPTPRSCRRVGLRRSAAFGSSRVYCFQALGCRRRIPLLVHDCGFLGVWDVRDPLSRRHRDSVALRALARSAVLGCWQCPQFVYSLREPSLSVAAWQSEHSPRVMLSACTTPLVSSTACSNSSSASGRHSRKASSASQRSSPFSRLGSRSAAALPERAVIAPTMRHIDANNAASLRCRFDLKNTWSAVGAGPRRRSSGSNPQRWRWVTS
jgi:hypothetical protein